MGLIIQSLQQCMAVGEDNRRFFGKMVFVLWDHPRISDAEREVAYLVDEDSGIGKRFRQADLALGAG